jgi:hypothetical protein
MPYIFESPDGGSTIYRREIGSDKRELYIEHGSPVKLNYGMWADIIKLGTTNAAVQDALERLIVIYELSKP